MPVADEVGVVAVLRVERA
jgi:Arc/MetJ family transcription regulator